MFQLRLKLIVTLLASSCAASAAVALPACNAHCPDWAAPESFTLAPDADIVAAWRFDYDGQRYLVAAGGVVIELDAGGSRHQPVDGELHGFARTLEELIVVGDGGALAVKGVDDTSWETVDIGTTADLWQVVTSQYIDGRHVIVGDGVMFAYDPETSTWEPITPPEGGWGDLRGFSYDVHETLLIAVGRGGLVWTAERLEGPWKREDPGIDADLTVIQGARAGGVGGVVVERGSDGTWRRIDLGTTADVMAMFFDFTLTGDGQLFKGDERLAQLEPGLRALIDDGTDTDTVIAFGPAGTHQRVRDQCQYSDSGRPFIVDDAPHTAPAERRADWCAGAQATNHMSAGTGEGSAEFWLAAGLAEHASIASFARALLELMSLGAPPELLRATQSALADEVDHAALCFAQARRRGGVALGPGPLALDERAFARAGDPVAIALAVFEEGCVGEGVAAAEVALQAELCSDAETRAVLQTLAADETRHAALAWRTLRWLIDRHGEVVAAPLRRRLARLSAPDVGSERREHGLLSARERAALRRQVLREVVHPLASALLAAPAQTHAATA